MKLQKLYKICINKKDLLEQKEYEKESQVLEQLILCCFNNSKNRYELPKSFNIKINFFNKYELKDYLEKLLNIKILEVKLIKSDLLLGDTFLVILK